MSAILPRFPDSDLRRIRALNRDVGRINRASARSVELSTAASYLFDGLDGDSEGVYRFVAVGKIATAAANRALLLLPNGDATSGNYHNVSTRMYATDDAVESDTPSEVGLVYVNGGFLLATNGWNLGGTIAVEATIFAASGRERLVTARHTFWADPSSGHSKIETCQTSSVWIDTTTKIESLQFAMEGGGDSLFTGTVSLSIGA